MIDRHIGSYLGYARDGLSPADKVGADLSFPTEGHLKQDNDEAASPDQRH